MGILLSCNPNFLWDTDKEKGGPVLSGSIEFIRGFQCVKSDPKDV